MPEIIFAMAGCIFIFFIVWVICCCWWLSDKETLGERIIRITKQFGKVRWLVVYAVIVFTLWAGAMAKVLIFGFPCNERYSQYQQFFKDNAPLFEWE